MLLPFAIVPFLGAPYVPSKTKQLSRFLKSLNIPKTGKFVDIGSGDGSVVKLVARQYGKSAIGVELNPFLVLVSKARLLRYRTLAKVYYGNMWDWDIPAGTNVIYAFVMPKFMTRLKQKIETEANQPVLVITYSFKFPGLKPSKESDGFLAYTIKPLAK